MTATATSSQSGEGADKAIDGNESTLWHTSYAGVTGPQNITVDLGGKYEINKVTCLPRQSGNNGKITKYELQVSTNGQDFTKVAEGDWNTSSDLKTINFDAVEATHIRLVANEYVNGFASMAELNVHKNVEIPDEERYVEQEKRFTYEINVEEGEEYNTYVVTGTFVDRLLASVNIHDADSLRYFHKVLNNKGVLQQIREMGVQDGDMVRLNDFEFEYIL